MTNRLFLGTFGRRFLPPTLNPAFFLHLSSQNQAPVLREDLGMTDGTRREDIQFMNHLR